MELRK